MASNRRHCLAQVTDLDRVANRVQATNLARAADLTPAARLW
jgi:hypothetical protein